jgi:zinc transport system permease protein
MFDWLTVPLSIPVMRNALIAGIVLGALCALIGTFVVQRGLSFIGDGLAHAAFGGIAIGLFFGVGIEHAVWVALPFTVVVSLLIAWVLRRGKLRGDVATGVFFALSFAVGVIFLAKRTKNRAANAESVLLGSILSITDQNLEVIVLVSLATMLILAFTWSRLAYATFDRELAALSGVPVAVLDYMLLALTAVVIVVGVRAVGVVLVSSFIVIPAAAAQMIGRRLATVAAIAVAFGVGGSFVGLIASYHLDFQTGATIILTLGACFFVALAVARVRHH